MGAALLNFNQLNKYTMTNRIWKKSQIKTIKLTKPERSVMCFTEIYQKWPCIQRKCLKYFTFRDTDVLMLWNKLKCHNKLHVYYESEGFVCESVWSTEESTIRNHMGRSLENNFKWLLGESQLVQTVVMFVLWKWK